MKKQKERSKKTPTDQQIREKLRKKCVEKAKRMARERDDFKCRYCHQGEPQKRTHGSHVYSEGTNRAMSADVDNIICLCASHHMNGKWNKSSTDFNWHASPAEAMDWFKAEYPELYEILHKRTFEKKHLDIIYWQKKWESLSNL